MRLDGKGAAVHDLCQIGQSHHPIAMGGKVAAKPGDGCCLPVLAQGSTPFARAIARGQSSGCVRKESYIGGVGRRLGQEGRQKIPVLATA